MRGIFITGTDTGVGKTFVAEGIIRALRDDGCSVCPMKPVETGCGARLVPKDAMRLIRASGVEEPVDVINPYRFRLPTAPAVAAEIEGVRIRRERVLSLYRGLLRRYDLVLVEGAGGIMVPVYKDYLFVDLIKDLDVPVIIVTRPGLGTINHTLMTIEVARAHSINVYGVIINYSEDIRRDTTVKTNPEVIKRLGKTRLIGIVPYLRDDRRGMHKRIFTNIARVLVG